MPKLANPETQSWGKLVVCLVVFGAELRGENTEDLVLVVVVDGATRAIDLCSAKCSSAGVIHAGGILVGSGDGAGGCAGSGVAAAIVAGDVATTRASPSCEDAAGKCGIFPSALPEATGIGFSSLASTKKCCAAAGCGAPE